MRALGCYLASSCRRGVRRLIPPRRILDPAGSVERPCRTERFIKPPLVKPLGIPLLILFQITLIDANAPAWWLAMAVAFAVAVLATRFRLLTTDGAVAAFVLGTVALRAGYSWALFLLAWFLATALISRSGEARKHAALRGMVEKSGRRDAWQVLANGGVFALCAFVSITWDVALAAIAAAGALAAAGADTFGTEVGVWRASSPWGLRTGQRVPMGTSGAVTMSGVFATIFTALAFAGLAVAIGMVPFSTWIAITVGGISGALLDTLLGAWAQERRWCATCESDTEQRTHICGTRTERRGGIPFLNNDAVNLVCSVGGAGVSLIWVLVTH